ncbi:hypothetical protein [Corynebacterium hindlerae]|uniref:hypothetical protein n=1 Tax=Corynebacterium hindlerae TaxID=699041 RepID=UPI003AAD1559
MENNEVIQNPEIEDPQNSGDFPDLDNSQDLGEENAESRNIGGSANNPESGNNEDMFPRKVVEGLRKEAAKYRERAKAVDVLEQRLHEALVKLDGRLADPKDLAFDPEHLGDPEQLSAAITDLIARNPRMKAMRPVGDAGQGNRGAAKPEEFNLLTRIRGY